MQRTYLQNPLADKKLLIRGISFTENFSAIEILSKTSWLNF